MNDPAFGEWGRLIFPVDEGYWSGGTLEQLRLVWYNCIDPDKTVEICNYMKAHAIRKNGMTVRNLYMEGQDFSPYICMYGKTD